MRSDTARNTVPPYMTPNRRYTFKLAGKEGSFTFILQILNANGLPTVKATDYYILFTLDGYLTLLFRGLYHFEVPAFVPHLLVESKYQDATN